MLKLVKVSPKTSFSKMKTKRTKKFNQQLGKFPDRCYKNFAVIMMKTIYSLKNFLMIEFYFYILAKLFPKDFLVFPKRDSETTFDLYDEENMF
jgi:hypothetical protein